MFEQLVWLKFRKSFFFNENKVHILCYKTNLLFLKYKNTMQPIIITKMFCAFHYIYKLPYIFESKPQNIQCNYHVALIKFHHLNKLYLWHPFWFSVSCFHPQSKVKFGQLLKISLNMKKILTSKLKTQT